MSEGDFTLDIPTSSHTLPVTFHVLKPLLDSDWLVDDDATDQVIKFAQ